MAKDFMTVYKNILAIAPKSFVKVAEERIKVWPSDYLRHNFCLLVKTHITPDSSNPQTIAIYSELYNMGFAEVKAKFEEYGF